ncbi:hypothetical protein MNBD_IGNAVI01-1057 [hydrothermal vent metagenome]|uniref:Addiction module protein n=1 Tax=hydrothermal vent metagenome TaxID=652676 RepID=A0A3B1BVU8_9ZZZZ
MQRSIEPEYLNKIKELTIDKRILIVEDIWDSIVSSNEALSVSENQKTELNKRLNDYKNNPSDITEWDEVKNRIQTRL